MVLKFLNISVWLKQLQLKIKQHLLDVWFDRMEAETKFCVQTTIEADDEWLHFLLL